MGGLSSDFRMQTEQLISQHVDALKKSIKKQSPDAKTIWQVEDLYTFSYGQFIGATSSAITYRFRQEYEREPSEDEIKEIWGLINRRAIEVRGILESLKDL